MPSPIISVVIPVYNAAPYLEQCIRSVLGQTFRDLEVIAVNDGSTDNSAAILDVLAATDSRLRVFHNENKRVSATRNFGLTQASGAWIAFCDADDYMEPTMLETLHNSIQNMHADWAICNVNMICSDGSSKLRLHMLKDGVVDLAAKRPLFVEGLMRFYYDNANWNKLFKASVIKEHDLRFEEGMHIWEDLLFNLQYTQFASRVTLINQPLYNYRLLDHSLYSGDTSIKIPQFNRLFLNYRNFAEKHHASEELNRFREQMARITYYQLLYQCEVKARAETKNPVRVYRNYLLQLHSFLPQILQYPAEQRKGIQRVKKMLLHEKRFGHFAIIIAVKPFLRKPYRFFKKIVSK
ncbi:MAG: glycosyltransferase [Chitinophagaceae bacterium]|nr:glycosyltransferase [Chitinophagaceae bacterium]